MTIREAVEELRHPARATAAYETLAAFAKSCLVAGGYRHNLDTLAQDAIAKFSSAHENGRIRGSHENEFRAFFRQIVLNLAKDEIKKNKHNMLFAPGALDVGNEGHSDAESAESTAPPKADAALLSTGFEDAYRAPDMESVRALLQRVADDTRASLPANAREIFTQSLTELLAIAFDDRTIADLLPPEATLTMRNALYQRHRRCRAYLMRTVARIQRSDPANPYTPEEADLAATLIARL